MHINDGDTECMAVNKVIIFEYGKVVNVFVIAMNVFAKVGRGSSPKIQGVAIKISIKFSRLVEVKLLNTFNDFNGFNKTV